MEHDLAWWARAAAYAMFAAVGGILGHLMRILDKKHTVSWARAVLEGIAAGFVGILMLFICDASSLSAQWTGVIVGVSGWMGASASIRLLEILVRRRLNVQSPEDNTYKGPGPTPDAK